MAVFALASAGGSPGVTTAALALALGWPSQVIMAECDPSGGDALAGLLSGHLPARTGLLPLALEAGGGAEVPGDALWRQLIELDEERNCLLLAGISDPRQSAALQSSLPWIADALQGLKADVLADCGRLDAVAAVRPVLSAASLAVLVLRPTLRQVSRAVPRVEMLTNLVGRERVVTLLVGEGTASGREIARSLGVPVAGQLPDDPKTAGVLSDGLGSRRALDSRPLLRAATAAGRRLRDVAEAAGPRPGYADETVFSVTGSHAQPSLDPYDGGSYGGDQYRADQYRADQYGGDQYGGDPFAAGELEAPALDPPPDRRGPGSRGLDTPGFELGGIEWPRPDQPGPARPGPARPGKHALGPRPREFGIGPFPGAGPDGGLGSTPNGSTSNGGTSGGSGPHGGAQNGSRP
ncbi:MAG: hypothetical protein ACRDPO_19900 [Streptosporangiaceae bacterium]